MAGSYRLLVCWIASIGFFSLVIAEGANDAYVAVPSSTYDSCGFVLGSKAVGSGFWIGSNTFVTCLHVVGEAGEKFVVKNYNGKTFHPTLVIGFSAEDDLAILKLEPAHTSWLELETSPRSEERRVGKECK